MSLGMSLGMAENLLVSDPDAAGELLAEARVATGLALAELRDLVRGIHPPVCWPAVARVAGVNQFVDAVRRVAAGGIAMDPEVVASSWPATPVAGRRTG